MPLWPSLVKTPPLRVVLTGHVDHGKSTLLGRLLLATRSLSSDRTAELKRIERDLGDQARLAYLADQLKEERDQNITIDTTEFFLRSRRPIVLIDTPGHKQFLHNMMTGSSRADAALLLIDAEAGLQEQTRRHAFLLRFFKIPSLLIVINKMDRVGYASHRFEDIKQTVQTFLPASSSSTIIPVSALEDENIAQRSRRMPWHKGPCLLRALERLPAQSATRGPIRLPVQTILDAENQRWAAGRLVSGILKSGQSLRVQPTGETVTVKEIALYPQKLHKAVPGQSLALCLSSLKAIQRGTVLTGSQETLSPRQTIQAALFVVNGTLTLQESLPWRCSTQTTEARLIAIHSKFSSDDLRPLPLSPPVIETHQTALVTLTFADPILMEETSGSDELNRFILEKDGRLVAVGTLTHPLAETP